MRLQEFIKTFVEPNSLVRLWWKVGNNYEPLKDSLMMEWEILLTDVDNVVVGLKDILVLDDGYKEAINIIIK